MEIFSIPIKHVNCYVIKIQDFYVAIDAGWAGCINEYLKELHLNNIDPRQIKYLFITHFHPDHAGLAENFKQYGTRLVLFTHQTPYIPFMEKMISPNSSYMPLNQQTSLVLALEDSDSFFTEHRIPAQAFKTTGHSEDSITLIFQDGSASSAIFILQI